MSERLARLLRAEASGGHEGMAMASPRGKVRMEAGDRQAAGREEVTRSEPRDRRRGTARSDEEARAGTFKGVLSTCMVWHDVFCDDYENAILKSVRRAAGQLCLSRSFPSMTGSSPAEARQAASTSPALSLLE
eukprot:287968-Lingulodinium_polyedra.AAC.1